jgi:tetratricopeptide (TPR) repeat protein
MMRAGRQPEAFDVARAAAESSPQTSTLHAMWATMLLQNGRRHEAALVVESAAALGGGDGDAYDGLAFVAFRLGLHARSHELYRRAIGAAPDDARLWFNLASSERAFGAFDLAEEACTRAIELDPNLYGAYLLRSDLRQQSPASNHVDELISLLDARADNGRALIVLGHAVAKELDDLQRYDEAFAWLSRAARARRAALAYDVGTDLAKLERIRDVYAEPPPLVSPDADGSNRFAFIVGLPRSGTTLVERILTGLPEVRSNGETDNFMRALLTGTPNAAGDVFARAIRADRKIVASEYQRLASAEGEANLIIDKLPLNYLYLGAIAQALPQARLILLRRSALDSCFAMFRTLFGEGYPFSYDLQDLARYYAAWERLMTHWCRTLGDRLHVVRYEHLVENADLTGMNLARYCGLEWCEDALRIERNPAISRTASASQVRRPIYSTSIGYWRRYGRHLSPLVEALRELGVDVETEADSDS